MIGSLTDLELDGNLQANGNPPNPPDTPLASGGAGGSIQLWMKNLKGSGTVAAKGGNGYQYSGEGWAHL